MEIIDSTETQDLGRASLVPGRKTLVLHSVEMSGPPFTVRIEIRPDDEHHPILVEVDETTRKATEAQSPDRGDMTAVQLMDGSHPLAGQAYYAAKGLLQDISSFVAQLTAITHNVDAVPEGGPVPEPLAS